MERIGMAGDFATGKAEGKPSTKPSRRLVPKRTHKPGGRVKRTCGVPAHRDAPQMRVRTGTKARFVPSSA